MAEEREAKAEETRSEGFLARWSRRKRAAREGVAAKPEPEVPPPGERPPQAAADAAVAEQELVDLAQLPKIEEITAETDLSAFFRKGVPTALRNAALRRAWSLDPTIRDFIGPADYAWDWNTPGGVPDFLDGVGETPAIRALVEGMFSPPSTPLRAAEEDRPTSLAAAEDRPALSDAVRLPGTPPPSPIAEAEAGEGQGESEGKNTGLKTGRQGGAAGGEAPRSQSDSATPSLRPPPPRRHGGALPS